MELFIWRGLARISVIYLHKYNEAVVVRPIYILILFSVAIHDSKLSQMRHFQLITI